MSHEDARVAALSKLFGHAPAWKMAIGDDCAALAWPGGELVVSVDAQVEGVHFVRGWLALADVGYRATMAAASDLAAMGAEPVGALSALTLPAGFSDAELEALAAGQAEAARELALPIVGGNLSAGPCLSLTTTVLGRLASAPALLRSGARPGDRVAVSGPLGLAAAGLAFLQGGNAAAAEAAPALAAWRRPVARLDAGRAARGLATSCIDVSDGLTRDLHRVAEASHVTLLLDGALAEASLAPDLVHAARALGRDPLGLALGGGEDYAIAATFPAHAVVPRGFVTLGEVQPRGASSLVWREGSRLRPLPPSGFDHFA